MQKIIKIAVLSLLVILIFSCDNASEVSNRKKEFEFNKMMWLPDGKALISWKGYDTNIKLYIDDCKVDPIKKEDFCLVFDYPTGLSKIELIGENENKIVSQRLTIDNSMIPSNLIVAEDTNSKLVEFMYPDKVFENEKEFQEYESEKNRYASHPMPCYMWDISWKITKNVTRQFVNIIYNNNYTTTYEKTQCNLRERLFWYLDEEKNKNEITDRTKPIWKLHNDYRDENQTESTVQVMVTVFNKDMTIKGECVQSLEITYPVIVK